MDQNKSNDILSFNSKRVFNVAAKRLLIVLEDLQKCHDINFNKLRSGLPEEYQQLIEMSEILDSPRFMHFRKRILDIINDGFREFGEELIKYDVTLKN